MEFLKGYLSQTDTQSCGPVVTLNAEIWQGKQYISCGWEVLGPRRYLLNTSYNNFPVRGTLWEDMSRSLSQLGISNSMLARVSRMKQELEKGNALIVMYTYPDQTVVPGCRIEGHYVFVYPSDGRIYITNHDRKYFTKWETFERTVLKDNPTDAEGNIYPRAWVISK